ncbi:MAG: hypothetical protein M3R57_03060 [Chloroflexota bacterium]|nr:hypothetical protein [Chloroflexota bacterium]
MPDRRDPSKRPVVAFVVETQMKPDGRLIHYYEWPDRPPEPKAGEPTRAARQDRPDRSRV